MRSISKSAAVALVAALSGCTSPDVSERIAEVQAPIYNAGDGLVAPDNNAHPQVFTMRPPTPGGLCTASLIASNAVLTAAHCVAKASELPCVFAKDTGNFSVNVTFNAPSNVATALQSIIPWTTTDSNVFPHPLYQNNGTDCTPASVDVAVLVMPTSIPRCAMKPLRVVNQLPSPTIDPQDEGTLHAWTGMLVRAMGAGRTDAMCTNGTETNMSGLLTDISGVFQDSIAPHKPVLWHPAPGLVSNISHLCQGDSGGPILSTDIDPIFHTNIVKDQIISVNSTEANGPVLQASDIRSWLVSTALDRDGDGKEAWEDNCDTIFNPNQADSDGDGIGDACDTFPGIDDCADADGDGLFDQVDPCPSNPDNTNTDGDGLPDCADPCPNDGRYAFGPLVDKYGDADRDGICNSDDDCVFAASSKALNCNDVSETFQHETALSDACDPVPCPSFVSTGKLDTSTSQELQYCVDIPAPFCPLEPGQKAWQNCANLIQFDLKVRALASHDEVGTPTTVPSVPTTMWFCQRDIQTGRTCDTPFDITDDRLKDSDCTAEQNCPNKEIPADHFHRMTINGTDPNTPINLTYDYSANDWVTPEILLTWDYIADYTRWTTGVTPVMADPGSPDLLFGTSWAHASTTVGEIEHGKQLANHHELDFGPIVAKCTSCSSINIGNPAAPKGVLPGGMTVVTGPSTDAEARSLIWRPLPTMPVDGFQRLEAQPQEAHVILPVGSKLWLAATGRDDNCQGEIVNERLGVHLITRLGDTSLVWTNVVEPDVAQGAGAAFPLAIALSQNGEDLIDTVRTDGKRLLADQDRGDTTPSKMGSPNAFGYVPVLTRMRRGIFVIGGSSPVTGQPTREMWFTGLGDAVWGRLIPKTPYAPENVLAATYAFSTDELYILDDISGQARLVAIDLATNLVTTLGMWPRHTAWDRHWLIVDRDGSVLIASSNSSMNRHAIARLSVLGPNAPAVSGVAKGNRALVLGPMADQVGYTLIKRQSQGNNKVKVDRLRDLDFKPANFAELGKQL